MIVDVVMPKMGESITEGTILEWRKKPGETISLDEILLEIGTDKVDSEIPSPTAGTVVELLAEPNDVLDVGAVIARIETDASAAVPVEPPSVESPPQPEPAPEPIEVKPAVIEPSSPPSQRAPKPTDRKFYTPVVRKIAKEHAVFDSELASIAGSGKNGRVTKKDILTYLDSHGAAPASMPTSLPVVGGEVEEMDHMRKLIADHMRKSLDTAAHVYLMTEVDMTSIVDFVATEGNAFYARERFNLTYTPFIVLAATRALQSFPDMNSALNGTTIVRNRNVNIGLAVAVEQGLMVPVIPRCEELNFLGLCRKVRDIAIRTRDKQISPDELQGSTFSITNFGVFNVTMGTPIINQPNVGILGIGTIRKRAVVLESETGDSIGIRSMMVLSLGFDHRLVDGAGGARFIESIQSNLESMELEKLF